jgi:hypothetical protein
VELVELEDTVLDGLVPVMEELVIDELVELVDKLVVDTVLVDVLVSVDNVELVVEDDMLVLVVVVSPHPTSSYMVYRFWLGS